MTLKQDLKVYYETFPDALRQCDFCTRTFRTLAGLRMHALRMHANEIDAIKAENNALDEAAQADADARDECGERGTHGCACQSHDARMCYVVRYDIDPADDDLDREQCECLCHNWRNDDDSD